MPPQDLRFGVTQGQFRFGEFGLPNLYLIGICLRLASAGAITRLSYGLTAEYRVV